MPMFDFVCTACGNKFEELVFGDESPACPQCGAVCAPERLLPAYASIQRRGGVKAAAEGLLAQKGGPDGHAGKGTGTGTGDGSAAGEAGHA